MGDWENEGVEQAFQPAILRTSAPAGWKACSTPLLSHSPNLPFSHSPALPRPGSPAAVEGLLIAPSEDGSVGTGRPAPPCRHVSWRGSMDEFDSSRPSELYSRRIAGDAAGLESAAEARVEGL